MSAKPCVGARGSASLGGVGAARLRRCAAGRAPAVSRTRLSVTAEKVVGIDLGTTNSAVRGAAPRTPRPGWAERGFPARLARSPHG